MQTQVIDLATLTPTGSPNGSVRIPFYTADGQLGSVTLDTIKGDSQQSEVIQAINEAVSGHSESINSIRTTIEALEGQFNVIIEGESFNVGLSAVITAIEDYYVGDQTYTKITTNKDLEGADIGSSDMIRVVDAGPSKNKTFYIQSASSNWAVLDVLDQAQVLQVGMSIDIASASRILRSILTQSFDQIGQQVASLEGTVGSIQTQADSVSASVTKLESTLAIATLAAQPAVGTATQLSLSSLDVPVKTGDKLRFNTGLTVEVDQDKAASSSQLTLAIKPVSVTNNNQPSANAGLFRVAAQAGIESMLVNGQPTTMIYVDDEGNLGSLTLNVDGTTNTTTAQLQVDWFDINALTTFVSQAAQDYINNNTPDAGSNVSAPRSTAPSNPNVGDIWVKSTENNLPYVWTGSQWQRLFTAINGGDITAGTLDINRIKSGQLSSQIQAEVITQIEAQGVVSVTRSANAPASPNEGDIWVDSDNGEKPYVYNGGWQRMFTQISGGDIVTGSIDVDKLNASALTSFVQSVDLPVGSNVFTQDTAPTSGMAANDVWYDSNDGYKPYVYNGSSWVPAYTSISGNHITTGTISADRIDVASLVSVQAFQDAVSNAMPTDIPDDIKIAMVEIDPIDNGSYNNGDLWNNVVTGYWWVYRNGGWRPMFTVIDGGRITTGTISAARIDVANLFSQTIDLTGEIRIGGEIKLKGGANSNAYLQGQGILNIDARSFKVWNSSSSYHFIYTDQDQGFFALDYNENTGNYTFANRGAIRFFDNVVPNAQIGNGLDGPYSMSWAGGTTTTALRNDIEQLYEVFHRLNLAEKAA